MLKRISAVLLLTLVLLSSSLAFAGDYLPGPKSADTLQVEENE